MVCVVKQELVEELRTAAKELKQSYDYTPEQLLAILAEHKCVPATVFSNELSPLQALVTYLHDHDKECFATIAKQLSRSYRAVWGAYQHEGITITATKYSIPLTTFDDKKSVLETVVQYLRTTYHMKFTDIAKLLNKDSRTIWTAWNRAQKKDGKNS